MMNIGAVDHDAITRPFPKVHIEHRRGVEEHFIPDGSAAEWLRMHPEVLLISFDPRDTVLDVRDGMASSRRIGTRIVPIDDIADGTSVMRRVVSNRRHGIPTAIGLDYLMESDDGEQGIISSMARAF
jgi:hypothetical protein